MAVLVPALKELREQLNAIFPNRDKTSDGWIGDYAHQTGTSSHNPDDTSHENAEWDNDSDSSQEVRAIDIDVNFNKPGVSAQDLVNHLVKYAKNGTFDWLRYVIYNRKMYHQNNGWVARDYDGPNPHIQHIHVNNDFSQAADNIDNVNYRLNELLEEQVATQFNADDKNELRDAAESITTTTAWPTGGGLQSKVGNGVLNAGFPLTSGANRTPTWANIQAIYTKQLTLESKVDALETHLDTVTGDLAYIKSILDSFTADYAGGEPNALYDTIVDAIEATHTP